MGISPFSSCSINYATGPAPAPNPSPERWELLEYVQFYHAYVLAVRYLDCTNFEGVKVMVFRGQYVPRRHLDPHFSAERNSPLARFRPDAEGKAWAEAFARSVRP